MIRAEWGDLMVPDKFNMVEMGGIDLIMMQGESVPGLYDKLIAAISNCRYQCLYNWLFDGVVIPPTYVQLKDVDGEVFLNEGVSVTSDDVIHIYSLEPGPVDPEIIPLLAEENGVYNVPTGKDGFNPVTVDVPSYTPVIEPITITENGTYNAPVGVDGYAPVVVNVEGGNNIVSLFESDSVSGTSISNVVLSEKTSNYDAILIDAVFASGGSYFHYPMYTADTSYNASLIIGLVVTTNYFNIQINSQETGFSSVYIVGSWGIKSVYGIKL